MKNIVFVSLLLAALSGWMVTSGCGIKNVPFEDVSVETKCAALASIVELGITPILQNNPVLIPAFKEVSARGLLILTQENAELRQEEVLNLFEELVTATGGAGRSAALVRGLLRVVNSMIVFPEETEVLKEEVLQYARSVMDGVNFAVMHVQ